MVEPVRSVGSDSGLARAFWWAYERAPAPVDSLFQLGRRYFMPILRHRLPVHQLAGRTEAGGAAVTVITVGGAMTLDALVGRLFLDPPQREAVDALSPRRVCRGRSRRWAPAPISCSPAFLARTRAGRRALPARPYAGRRPPAPRPSREATLARATRTVRYDVRRSRSAATAGPTRPRPPVSRGFTTSSMPVHRRPVRAAGRYPRAAGPASPLSQVRRAGLAPPEEDTTVGGEMVREHGHDLRLLVQALHPQWPNRLEAERPGCVQRRFHRGARKLGLGALDFGGSLPWPTDGIFASKRAWGVTFEGHVGKPPGHPALVAFPLAPGFGTSSVRRRCCSRRTAAFVLGAFAQDAAAGDRPPDSLNPRLIPRGVHGTFIWVERAGRAPHAVSTGVVALEESASPEMLNRVSRQNASVEGGSASRVDGRDAEGRWAGCRKSCSSGSTACSRPRT